MSSKFTTTYYVILLSAVNNTAESCPPDVLVQKVALYKSKIKILNSKSNFFVILVQFYKRNIIRDYGLYQAIQAIHIYFTEILWVM